MSGDAPRHRDYPHPPILEALCQLTFDAVDWNVATPGQLWEAIREDYPLAPEQQDQQEVQVAMQPGSAPAFSVNHGGGRIVYRNKSGTKLVIASRDTLSVNSLSPYEGWKSLRRRFRDAAHAFAKAVSPVSVRQVTIKYINRIPVPAGESADRYFNIPIWAPAGAGEPNAVLSRIETSTQDGTPIQAVFATLPPPEGGWLLDLELRAIDVPAQASVEDLVEVADQIHRAENAVFEQSITEDCRKLFR